MAWDDDNNKDPWRPQGKRGPADLDAIVKEMQRKLRGLFGGRGGRGGGGDESGQTRGPGPKIGSGMLSLGVAILLGLWGLSGLYMVDQAERAVVLRFGEYVNVTQPGLNWHLPFPIEQIVKINTEEVVTWPYSGSMLTRDENIVVINLVVQYRRTDPELFLFSLRDPEDTLQDVTASAIREIIGKNDVNYILTEGRLDIAATALDLLQATLDSYQTGITVYEVNLQEAQFPEEVQASVQDVVKAREDKARVNFEAQTYRDQLLPIARGQAVRRTQDAEAYRAEVVNNAQGESSRFSQVLTEYHEEPVVTRQRMHLETLEAILANSTKVLVDTEGGNNLLYLPLDQLMQRSARDDETPIDGVPLNATGTPQAGVGVTSPDRSGRR